MCRRFLLPSFVLLYRSRHSKLSQAPNEQPFFHPLQARRPSMALCPSNSSGLMSMTLQRNSPHHPQQEMQLMRQFDVFVPEEFYLPCSGPEKLDGDAVEISVVSESRATPRRTGVRSFSRVYLILRMDIFLRRSL